MRLQKQQRRVAAILGVEIIIDIDEVGHLLCGKRLHLGSNPNVHFGDELGSDERWGDLLGGFLGGGFGGGCFGGAALAGMEGFRGAGNDDALA